MSILEKAVADLADALDALEDRISDRMDDQPAGAEAALGAARHARIAREKADAASRELSAVMRDLRDMIGPDKEAP
ncbi:MAG: hypothetical protein AAGD92_02335 [Pseudomonadota bacterium]